MRFAAVVSAALLTAGCALPVTKVQRTALNPPSSKLQRVYVLSRLHVQRLVPAYYSTSDVLADRFEEDFCKTLQEELGRRGVTARVRSVPHLALQETPPPSELDEFAPDAVMIVTLSHAMVQSSKYGYGLTGATIDVAVVPRGAATIWSSKVEGRFDTIWSKPWAPAIPASIARATVEQMAADGLLPAPASQAAATP